MPSTDVQNILVRLEIPVDATNPEVSYVPGDHVAVFPVHSDEDVDFVLKHLTGLPKNHQDAILQLQEKLDGSGRF